MEDATRPELGRGCQHRIEFDPVETELEVQVRPGGETCVADERDHLAARHPRSRRDARGEGGEVSVAGHPTGRMANVQHVTVAARGSRVGDHAVSGGQNWRALGRAEVDALVHADDAEDWMEAHAEVGRDP